MVSQALKLFFAVGKLQRHGKRVQFDAMMKEGNLFRISCMIMMRVNWVTVRAIHQNMMEMKILGAIHFALNCLLEEIGYQTIGWKQGLELKEIMFMGTRAPILIRILFRLILKEITIVTVVMPWVE